MPAAPRIAVDDDQGTRIVRFHDPRLIDDLVIRDVAEQVNAALPRSGPVSIVLDFSGVDAIASMMLSKLIVLQRRVDSAGGSLRLCELSDGVRGVFRSSNLDRLFAIDRDRNEALEAARERRR